MGRAVREGASPRAAGPLPVAFYRRVRVPFPLPIRSRLVPFELSKNRRARNERRARRFFRRRKEKVEMWIYARVYPADWKTWLRGARARHELIDVSGARLYVATASGVPRLVCEQSNGMRLAIAWDGARDALIVIQRALENGSSYLDLTQDEPRPPRLLRLGAIAREGDRPSLIVPWESAVEPVSNPTGAA